MSAGSGKSPSSMPLIARADRRAVAAPSSPCGISLISRSTHQTGILSTVRREKRLSRKSSGGILPQATAFQGGSRRLCWLEGRRTHVPRRSMLHCTAGAIEKTEKIGGKERKWRRRESNPRPVMFQHRRLRVYPVDLSLAGAPPADRVRRQPARNFFSPARTRR